ncbi:SCP-like protein [Oesophagostomum dentatum]|uniref:SCP-like protein n=1 Tax=Oesophagostomum dentatum TaxID=61180 RepID=A0A0B1T1J5_OESDE|nr:SCP-like protein [Oesophagostomum dentatum]
MHMRNMPNEIYDHMFDGSKSIAKWRCHIRSCEYNLINFRVLIYHGSELAVGATRNGRTGKKCRKASQMPTLIYCCELEKTAYERASQCNQTKSTLPEGISENSYTFTQELDGGLDRAANAATQLWWSEIETGSGIDQIRNTYYSTLGISSFAKKNDKKFCPFIPCTNNKWNLQNNEYNFCDSEMVTEENNIERPDNYEMTNQLRRTFLNKHNLLRSLLALGVVSNGRSGKLCRKAAKMSMLAYSYKLEKSAYDRANLCSHLNSTPPEGVAENRYKFTSKLDRELDKAAQAIASDLTTAVGCAVVRCRKMINTVCHYETLVKENSENVCVMFFK